MTLKQQYPRHTPLTASGFSGWSALPLFCQAVPGVQVEVRERKLTREKETRGDSPLFFPAYDLTRSPPSERCALLSEGLEQANILGNREFKSCLRLTVFSFSHARGFLR